jgi:hypothetical protein
MVIVSKSDRKEISLTKKIAVWTRHCSGYSISEIVKLEKLPRDTIRSIIDRKIKSGDSNFKSKFRSGHLKIEA